ncbi:hypothetical protein [Desulfurobacterium crinifex]
MNKETEYREKEILEAEFLRNTEGTHWIVASGPKPRSSFILHTFEWKQLKKEHLSESERNKKLTVNLPSKEESKEEELLVTRAPLRPMSFAINHLIGQLSEEYLSKSKSRKNKKSRKNR